MWRSGQELRRDGAVDVLGGHPGGRVRDFGGRQLLELRRRRHGRWTQRPAVGREGRPEWRRWHRGRLAAPRGPLQLASHHRLRAGGPSLADPAWSKRDTSQRRAVPASLRTRTTSVRGATGPVTLLAPSGQRTSIRLTSVAVPSPKCATGGPPAANEVEPAFSWPWSPLISENPSQVWPQVELFLGENP